MLKSNPKTCLWLEMSSQFHCIIQRVDLLGDQAVILTSYGIILWRILTPDLKNKWNVSRTHPRHEKEELWWCPSGEVESRKSKRIGRLRTQQSSVHCDGLQWFSPLLVARTAQERQGTTFLMRFNKAFLVLHSQYASTSIEGLRFSSRSSVL